MPTLTAMKEYVGGLSEPSKMPCFGYSLPAKECNVGSRLRSISDSTCSSCYALKGRYVFKNVQKAMYNRLASIDKPLWIEYMSALVNHYGKTSGHFRWHDSGDIQSVSHLAKIVEVCNATPTVKHWLPTREYRIVREFLKENSFPDNLTVRISAPMINGSAPTIPSTVQSLVHRGILVTDAHVCPAPKQNGKCGDCRACWSNKIERVSYHVH